MSDERIADAIKAILVCMSLPPALAEIVHRQLENATDDGDDNPLLVLFQLVDPVPVGLRSFVKPLISASLVIGHFAAP